MTHDEWLALPRTQVLLDELHNRIENMKDMKPPADSHAGGITMALIEAHQLVLEGPDD